MGFRGNLRAYAAGFERVDRNGSTGARLRDIDCARKRTERAATVAIG
jgi:hypothetical protein